MWRNVVVKMILKLTVELDSSMRRIVRRIHPCPVKSRIGSKGPRWYHEGFRPCSQEATPVC